MSNRRIKKTKSIKPYGKGAPSLNYREGFLTILVFFFVSACSSAEIKDLSQESQRKANNDEVVQLTQSGDNLHPRWSREAQALLFSSANRGDHLNFQIYEMNIQTKALKRLSFQPVDNSHPFYGSSNDEIYFSSPIDELKEHANQFISGLISKESKTQNPKEATEIYRMNRSRATQERLTASKWFDGHGDADKTGKILIFSSSRSQRPAIFQLDLQSKKVDQLTQPDQGFADVEPRIAPDKSRIVWTRKNLNEGLSQIWVSELNATHPKALTTAPAIHHNPSWSSDSEWILFSSNRSQKENFSIYAIKSNGECIIKLVDHSLNDSYPEMSPQGDRLVFVSKNESAANLYSKALAGPLNCDSGE